MAGFLFNIGSQQLQDGTTVWASSTIRARLVLSASGAPDKDADVMTGIGNTDAAASVSVSGRSAPTTSDVRDRTEYTSSNVTFTSVPAIGACNRMVFYRYNANDAGSVPLVCVEITEVTPNGGDVTVTMPTNGWFYTQQ
jgi:hypothetical protein